MKFLHALLAILSPILLFSQNEQLIELQIESEVYDTTRQVTVYLPEVYFEGDTTDRFVVAYLFDGQFSPYLSMTSGAMEYYSQTEESIPMIIVSVHSHDRREELIPMDAGQVSSKNVGAERLSDHLREEVIPFIESNYRTKAFRLAIGHSLGGSYVLNELFEENSIFHGAIAASPNLRLNDEQIVLKGEDYLKKNPLTNKYVYVTAGDEGSMELSFKNSLDKLDTIVQEQNAPNFDWNYDRLEKENHMTTFLRTYDDGLNHLSDKWWITDESISLLSEAKDLKQALKNCFTEQESFTNEQMEFTFENLQKIIRRLAKINEYETAIAAISITEERSDADTSWTRNVRQYYSYKSSIHKGDMAFEKKEFNKASEHYLVGMKMKVFNGTHMDRLKAIRSFAQSGHFEAAFMQLSLLEEHFGWRGRGVFENDSFMKPLHEDLRWEKLMEEFDKNHE